MTNTTKTAAELLAERKALNAKIRAAQRAEKAAVAKAVLDAKHALGVRLADALGLSTVEAVEAARAGLDLDAVRALVKTALVVEDEAAQETREERPEGGSSEGDQMAEEGESDGHAGESSTEAAVHQNSSPTGHEFSARSW